MSPITSKFSSEGDFSASGNSYEHDQSHFSALSMRSECSESTFSLLSQMPMRATASTGSIGRVLANAGRLSRGHEENDASASSSFAGGCSENLRRPRTSAEAGSLRSAAILPRALPSLSQNHRLGLSLSAPSPVRRMMSDLPRFRGRGSGSEWWGKKALHAEQPKPRPPTPEIDFEALTKGMITNVNAEETRRKSRCPANHITISERQARLESEMRQHKMGAGGESLYTHMPRFRAGDVSANLDGYESEIALQARVRYALNASLEQHELTIEQLMAYFNEVGARRGRGLMR